MQQISEQNSPETGLFKVTQFEYAGRQYHVSADSYDRAREWFDAAMQRCGGDLTRMESDLSDDKPVYVTRVDDVRSDTPVWAVGDADPLGDTLTLGYDYGEETYVFTDVDVTRTDYIVGACSPEQALERAQAGAGVSVSMQDTYHTRYSCSEDERIIVDGNVIRYHREEDLTAELLRQYPDGMTVILEDESLQNLLDYRHADYEDEWRCVRGMVDAVGSRMAGAHGTLEARLDLRPVDYGLLSACDSTYYSSELSDLGWDAGDNATSVMLSTETSLKDARIEAGICRALLDRMVIEGRPYREVMDLVDRHNIKDDTALRHYFDARFLKEQPQWKLKMASDATADEVNRHFLLQTAPVYHQEQHMWQQLREQAAKDYGFEDAAAWERAMQQHRDPSSEMADRLRQTAERFAGLFLPYQQASGVAFEELHRFKDQVRSGYIRRFDRQAEMSVSDIRGVQRGNGNFAIRCKIDGVQQPARDLSRDDAQSLLRAENKAAAIREIAQRYFRVDILDAMRQTQQKGMKR